MQQRQLRLGDVIDDYCPRERRVTNHAIVAMVGQDVKQTRCTTCETEHEYRQAKVPPQRKRKEAPSALYSQVAAGAPKPVVRATAPPQAAADPPAGVAAVADESDGGSSEPPIDGAATAPEQAAGSNGNAAAGGDEEGRVHRQLIRATLPRPEGQPQSRPLPEFTVRQSPAGPSRFRQSGGGFRPQRGGGGRPSSGGGSHAGQGRHTGGRSGGHGSSGRRGADRSHQSGGSSRHSHAGSMTRSGKKRSK